MFIITIDRSFVILAATVVLFSNLLTGCSKQDVLSPHIFQDPSVQEKLQLHGIIYPNATTSRVAVHSFRYEGIPKADFEVSLTIYNDGREINHETQKVKLLNVSNEGIVAMRATELRLPTGERQSHWTFEVDNSISSIATDTLFGELGTYRIQIIPDFEPIEGTEHQLVIYYKPGSKNSNINQEDIIKQSKYASVLSFRWIKSIE